VVLAFTYIRWIMVRRHFCSEGVRSHTRARGDLFVNATQDFRPGLSWAAPMELASEEAGALSLVKLPR
jgi:hypothetical protein